MIKLLTKVKIVDNSGGIEGRCIWIREKTGKIGEIIRVSIEKIGTTNNQIQKGDVHYAMIVRTKKINKGIKYGDNAAILVKKGEPIGTRIKGPISSYIKNKKILALTNSQI